jgi:HAD superfamily hydrolase (TIGR01509 family)
MTKIALVIFDFDGTLVDSEILAARIEAEMLSAAGATVSVEEMVELYAGLTFKDIMLRVEQTSPVPLQASMIAETEAAVDRRLRRGVDAIEGAAAALRSLRLPRCICSNSSKERIVHMLASSGLDRVLAAEDIFSALDMPGAPTKPAPDVFLHAAAARGVEPSQCIVVEDSVHGVHGARNAGMRVIGFTGGAHSYLGHADALTEAGAETVIRRWAEFEPTLAALSEWTEA